MRLTLAKYVTKLDSQFEQVRRVYEKAMDKLKESDEYHKEKMKELNRLAQNKELERYMTEQAGLKDILKTNKDSFDTFYAELRDEARKTFRPLFTFSGHEVDSGLLSVLEAGVMTNDELIEQGMFYIEQGNLTMLRLLAKFADERSGQAGLTAKAKADLNYLAKAGQEAGRRIDLEFLDGMKEICDLCLREDRGLADGTFHNVYDIAVYLKGAEAFAIDVQSPFDDE